jgi:hypothetical protein
MNDAIATDALMAFSKVLVGRIWPACTTIKWPHTSKLTLWWVHAATGWSRVDVADSPGLDFTKTNYIHSGVSFSYRHSKPYLSVYYSPF